MAKFESKEHLVSLTTDEVYTILLLTYHVAGDKECYDLYEKLQYVIGRELNLDDAELVTIVNEGHDDFYIKIQQEDVTND